MLDVDSIRSQQHSGRVDRACASESGDFLCRIPTTWTWRNDQFYLILFTVVLSDSMILSDSI